MQIVCPSCERVGSVPDDFGGGLVRCPQCKTVMQVPAASSSSRPKSSAPRTSRAPAPAPAPASRTERAPRPAPAQPQAPAPGGVPVGAVIGGGIGVGVLVLGLVIALVAGGGKKAEPEKVAPQVGVDEGAKPPPVKVASQPVGQPAAPAADPGGNFSGTTSLTAEGLATGTSGAFAVEAGPALIQRIKQATVFIKMRIGKAGAVGTGFVIKADGDSALIATNRHVIDPTKDPSHDFGARPGEQPRLSVVFRSGEGGTEQELPAAVVAIDTDPQPQHDMAVLRVKGVRQMPRPIDPMRAVTPTEGMDLRIYGFPFGFDMNVTSRGNPSITINKGSLAALRRDDFGRLSMIQIDGSVNPGNSGGPILDDQGRLLGITTLKNTRADNIGYAIPAAELQKFLGGRVGDVDIAIQEVKSPAAIDLQFKAKLADPLARVRNVWANIADAPADYKPSVHLRPDESGDLPPMPGAKQVLLKIDRSTGIAWGNLPYTHDPGTPPGPGGLKLVRVQMSYVNGDGRTIFGTPVVYRVPRRPGNLVLRDNASGIEDKLRKTLNKLGELIDPAKDCSMSRTSTGVTISVPGKLHILSPQIKDKANKPVKNAPMVLADIDGDFVAHVKVAGDIRPGPDPSLDPRGRRVPFSIQGAGLLLWQDQDNYLRLERSCGTTGSSVTLDHRLILEVCKDGKEGGHFYVPVPEGPMEMLLVRQDGHLRCLFRTANQKGWSAFKELAAEFPAKVRIGLSAFNTAKRPFNAQFEEFVLVDKSDKERFDEELGQ